MYGAIVRVVGFAAAVMFSACLSAAAQSYPTRNIKILVPFAAGSGTDVVARFVGNELSQRLGQPVVIENQSGGATILATQATARAEPDGYTLFLTTSAHVILPSTHKQLPFNVIDDFTPIMMVCSGPLVLAAHPSFAAKSVKELIELARRKPGEISYASSGTGTAPHLAMELLKVRAGIDMVHVPYRGGSPAMNDVIAGVVPMYAAAPATALPHVKGGAVVALGQTGAKRSEFIKDIPTFAEQGVPDYDVELWYALLGPAKLPTDISGRLRKEITEILAKPEVRSRLLSLGFEPKPSSGDQLADTLRAEMKQWSEVAKAAKLSAE